MGLEYTQRFSSMPKITLRGKKLSKGGFLDLNQCCDFKSSGTLRLSMLVFNTLVEITKYNLCMSKEDIMLFFWIFFWKAVVVRQAVLKPLGMNNSWSVTLSRFALGLKCDKSLRIYILRLGVPKERF